MTPKNVSTILVKYYLNSLYLLLFACLSFNTLADNHRRDNYHKINQQRLQAQKDTNSYINMQKAYDACISKNASDLTCEQSLEEVKKEIERLYNLKALSGSANNSLNQQNNTSQVIVQDNRLIPWGVPSRPTLIYEPPTDQPRNNFTPAPGFTPKNRFQAGEGFN